MNRWAFCRPGDWKNTLALATTALTAVALVGCGGGGDGGDPGPGGGGGNTVTGRVVSASPNRAPVQGATVTLRDAAGNQVGQAATTDSAGSFTISNVPAGAVLFRVNPPATGFFQGMARFRNNDYDFARTATAGGPCLPDLVAGGAALPAGTTTLPDILVFETSVPPPPIFGCPR